MPNQHYSCLEVSRECADCQRRRRRENLVGLLWLMLCFALMGASVYYATGGH